MQLGLIGLGKMGFNMRERLRGGGHEVIGYDPRPEVTDVPDLAGLAAALTTRNGCAFVFPKFLELNVKPTSGLRAVR